jgi:hypothetical protein
VPPSLREPRSLLQPARTAGRLLRAAGTRAANQVAGPRFARRLARSGPPPEGSVVVFFAAGPENLYQFEQWRPTLEELAARRPVVVVVERPDTGEAILRGSSLRVVFARGSRALEDLVTGRDVRVVLYLNQLEPNFRMLRFPGPVHVQVGHGESDKVTSISNQHKAYDLTFVGGPAGAERLERALRGFDAATRTVQVGRPQLDHADPGAPDWAPGTGQRVCYAPTWEGDRPSLAYGSLASHGVALVESLLADPGVRLLYRPHPRTGMASPVHRAADRRIRELVRSAGERHLVDTGPYGWQWAFADACVTDVSAVAYDWLATGKPLVLTEPASSAFRPSSPLLDRLPLLPATRAGHVLEVLRARGLDGGEPDRAVGELARYYFGETADRASTARFLAAVEECCVLAAG